MYLAYGNPRKLPLRKRTRSLNLRAVSEGFMASWDLSIRRVSTALAKGVKLGWGGLRSSWPAGPSGLGPSVFFFFF